MKLLKYIFLLLTCTLLAWQSQSQNYGNEWISLNQSYYRFSISETGIYRVSNQELQNAGILLDNFEYQNIQLFFKGQEIPCIIKVTNSGLIDYIEFYAEKNDGWFDVEMHETPESQANPNYSLINDTASVFFTWNNSFDNLRYEDETDVNFSGYTPASFCFSTSRADYTNLYLIGYDDCEYIKGEGYVDSYNLNFGHSTTKELTTPGFIYKNTPSLVEVAYLTKSHGPHNISVSGSGFQLDTTFQNQTTIRQTEETVISNLEETTSFTFTSIFDENSGETSHTHIAYVSLTYPRNFNVDKSLSFDFMLPASPSQKTYIELSGFIYDGEPYLYDLSRGLKITLVPDGDVLKALIPASNEQLKMHLVDENHIFNVDKISNVNFTNFANINSPSIIISHPKLWSQAQSYATYRNAYLVNVETLYNQFGYGIQKHPLAIRNFLNYAYNTWTIKPQTLLIIGKGIVAEDPDNNIDGYRNNPTYYENCLVPPMGYPPSDVLLSNKIGDTQYENAIATGRIAAKNENEVADYLNKVIEFEENQPAEWMKHAIHFGGGSYSWEHQAFAQYLRGFEDHFEDSLFGGYVSTFLKTSSEPIETSKTDSVKSLINNGISLLTFFGHGYTSGFDQNIDEPAAYSNQGKYPLMIANSCYSGNIHTPATISTSELWTLIPNKGTIGYFAVVGSGSASYLNTFSNKFYKNLSDDNYGQTLGEIIHTTRIEFQSALNQSRSTKSTLQEFTLHGDPAIVLNSFPQPDFAIESDDISFSPSILTTEIDSFEVHVVLTNVSKTTTQTFSVELTRILQDGTESYYTIQKNGLYFKDTVTFKLPTNSKKGQGLNQFYVKVDNYQQIIEMSESNNNANTSHFISSTDLFPIIPYNYSILPDNTMPLKAATSDPFVNNQTSIFQMDTTYDFSSGFLFEQEIIHGGGIIEWQTQQTFETNKTYFWRTAKKPNPDDDPKWSVSSFSFETGINGWQQNNFGQLIDNNAKFIDPNFDANNFKFADAPKILRATNIGRNYPGFDEQTLYSIGYSVDGIGDINTCQWKNAMLVAVIDSSTLIPWPRDIADFGHTNYESCRHALYFIFHVGNGVQAAMDNLINMVNNEIPDGYYVLVYSMLNGMYSEWSESHKIAFDNWGASLHRSIFDFDPYILFLQKGNLENTKEWTGSSDEMIKAEVPLISNFTYGYMNSPTIGPSKNWETLSWKSSKLEDNPEEIAYLNVIGVDNSGNETIIKDSLTAETFDLSTINANQLPYLKLQFFTRDENFKTPSQLNFWKVVYSPVSDFAINPERTFEFYSDTLQEGDEAMLSLAFENIGTTSMDSLLVKYWLQDANNNENTLTSKKLKPLNAGEYLIDSIKVNTMGYPGINSIWVELNPENENKGYDQVEQNHFNNLAQKTFFVEKDQSNPLLDVTFDGVHIMNGDLVSAKPEIIIQLADDNAYIPLNDTTLISFYLKDASGIEQKIPISNNPEVEFIEAQLPDNKAKVIYNHEFTKDGTYELRVRGKDVSGNESGAFDYIISFEVINESTITNVFNYPNPFSTSTRFVFELTGSEIPDEMRIDILTVTGKLVKVIYLSDLGNITIGKNITDFAWDGTDMYGDPLANGVYFYRVFSKLNGQTIKHRNTGTSQYFKNGFGKMYIMR